MAEIRRLKKQHPLYQDGLLHVLEIPGIEILKGKTFLITGATGLIGTHLIDALMAYNKRDADVTIYAVGRSKKKAEERLGEYYNDEHFHFLEQDVRSPLPDDLKVDYIIPLASNTHPLAYSQYPIETIEINIKGAEYALQKAFKCGATVLYPSTVEVYGDAYGNDEFTEDYSGKLNLSNSRSCYTESKRLSEALCQSYIAEKGVKVKIARLCRVFGPTMLMNDSKASSQFILKALEGEDIVLKSKGDQFFSFIHVSDAVSALFYVLIHGENGMAYNIANKGCDVHLKDFAEFCAKTAGTKVIYDIPSESEQKGFSIAKQAILNTQKLTGLGFKPSYGFESAIENTITILNGL